MKKCVVIYNPNSGKKKGKQLNIKSYEKIFDKYNYEVEFIPTKYKNHAKEIMVDLEDKTDLVIAVGGDGTFNEVVTGNLKRKKPLLISLIPFGTTNDIGTMFGLGKNINKNLNDILSGSIKNIDICSINDQPFVYVAGFGRFLHVPYDTPRRLKKRYGYIAYIFEAVKDFLKYATHLYDITVEVNGEKYKGLASFVLVSNANRIAGIKNFYKEVKLNDKKFEVLICNLKTKKDIMRTLFYLRTNDITKVSGFDFYRTDNLKITFHEKLRRPWCIDGEKLEEKASVYKIKVIPDIKMLLPNSISKELFIDEL